MKLWILTTAVNEYDQYGEYFVVAFDHKPTADELKAAVPSLEDYEIIHIVWNGGGRRNYEQQWWNLRELESGNPIPCTSDFPSLWETN